MKRKIITSQRLLEKVLTLAMVRFFLPFVLFLLLNTVTVFAQGQLGDIQFESDIERVSGQIGELRLGERRGSDDADDLPNDSYWGKKMESVIRAPEAEDSHKSYYDEQVKRKKEKERLEKLRKKDARIAKKTLEKAYRVHSEAFATWKELHDKFDELNKRWRYAAELLKLAIRDESTLVWGINDRIDESVLQMIRELTADLSEMRTQIDDFAFLYDGLYQPLHIRSSIFIQFAPSARRDGAEVYLRDLQALKTKIDRAKPAINRQYPKLEIRSEEMITKTKAFKDLVDEAHRTNRPWIVKRKNVILNQVNTDDKWRKDIRAALRELRAASSIHRPKSLKDLKPGDVVLLGTGGAFSKLTYVVGLFFSGRLHKPNPAAHAVAYLGRDAAGKPLYLNHTTSLIFGRGSHIIGETEFLQLYGKRKKYVARPQPVVAGRELLSFALQAANNTQTTFGTDFGLVGDDDVCGERIAMAVAKATGVDLIKKKLAPIEIHPSDFFDDDEFGWYFLVSPLQD